MGKTVVVLTCAHAEPEVSNERFTWLGEFLYDIKPDYVVDLGDGADMRSLNSFDTTKPQAIVSQNYGADIDAYNDAMERMRHPFRKHHRKRPRFYGFEGNHECFQGHTDIYVRDRGWVPASGITTNDYVMTMSGWEKVEKVHRHWYEGSMISFGRREFTVTPNHRVYYYTTQDKLLVKKAKDCPEEFDVPMATEGHTEGLNLTDDQIRFCAMALTDSYHTGKKVILYQSGDNAQFFRDVLDNLNIKYKEKRRDRAPKEICGKVLKNTQLAYEFSMDRPPWSPDQNKRIPDKFFALDEVQAQIFLDTLIFCDGSSFKDRQSTVFYGKKEICDGVQAFCNFHNNRASLTEYRPGHWRVNINPRSKFRVKKKVTGPIKDWVYCITVPSGNFLARQNGFSVFTGNSRIKKAIVHDPRLEGDRYGISFSHLNTDRWFDEYWPYENSAPAIHNYDGVDYAHYISSGNYGTAMSGEHHAYNLLKKRLRSTTVGHSHLRSIYFRDDAKAIGLVAGCFKGADESWAGQANRSWWSGVVVKRNLEDGYYEPQFISLKQLEEEYA